MSYDISMFWPWLLAALILGGIVGWLSDRWGSDEPLFHGWRKWAVIAWVIGLILAALHWLPGRAGLWLETALLFSFSYVVACLIGGWLRAIVDGEEPMENTAAKTATAPATQAPKSALAPVTTAPTAPPAASATSAPAPAVPASAAPTAPASPSPPASVSPAVN